MLLAIASCENSVSELDKNPETGKVYTVTPQGAVSSKGNQWRGYFRKGCENKVIVFFNGGGLSVDEYSAARGSSVNPPDGLFYFDDSGSLEDETHILDDGILSSKEKNPFKDWTIVVVQYSTGDLHCGTCERQYTGLDGSQHTIHYHGYVNFRLMMEKVLPFIGTPDALLISGSSAGAAATCLLSDDVIDMFPDTKNVTVVPDAFCLITDKWKSIAKEEWNAPAEIVGRIESDNLVLDCLKALHKDKPYAKILFGISPRDKVLALYQNYFTKGAFVPPAKTELEDYQRVIENMVAGFLKAVPDGGVNIWNDGNEDESTGTSHTITNGPGFVVDYTGQGSYADWIMNAVDGKVEIRGLELLK